MRVGLNLVYLVPGETGGMEVYARELIVALRRRRPDVELVAFVNREAAAAGEGPWISEIPSVTVPVKARRRSEWVRGEQQHLPKLAAREGVELLHSLASTAPARGSVPGVVTIHDVTYRVHPEVHFGVLALGMRVLVPLAARRSRRVIAVSRNTRDDLVRLLHVPAEKIDVVPNGVREPPPGSDAPPQEEIRARHSLEGRTVVLTASAKRRHKNLPRLLEALALIPAERRPVLLVPGYPTPHEQELREQARTLGVDSDTRFLGWVDAEELEGLYAVADAFVFPSLYEGFGLPILEAMARGVPVACSDRSSLPDVGGDAALLFDPDVPASIASAIETLLTDEREAERLRAAGRERVREFSWDRTARLTAATYERTLGRSAPA